MKCPNCQVPLVMTERSGVEIDYCPDCRGVWLDRGELDKIIDRSSQSVNENSTPAQPQMPPPQYPMHDPYKHGYKKKKKNFLDDIFDF